MIFLGAGASKELGVPTLQEFSKLFIDKLIDSGYQNEINLINKSLNEFGLSIDFEAIYSILESMTDPYHAVQNLGPVAAYYSKSASDLPKKKDFNDMLEVARKIIYDKCFLDKNKETKIISQYDSLFDAVKEQNINDQFIFNGKETTKPLDAIIATTNYDMSLETYFMSKGIEYNDGYMRKNENTIIKDFDFNRVFDPFRDDRVGRYKHILIKLHGSIWQFERENKLFKTITDPDAAPINVRPNIGKEMMIYPTHQKDILQWNYYHFFNLFKKIEWRRLLVIGYSFRDQPINTYIIDRLKHDINSRLIVFHPNPFEILKNLNYDVPERQLSIIPAYFGKDDKNVFDNLINYVEGRIDRHNRL